MDDNSTSKQPGQTTENVSFGHRTAQIFQNPELAKAKDIIVIARNPADGTPQLWASGDQSQAQALLRETAVMAGVKEYAQT